jgi:hypothetical protein
MQNFGSFADLPLFRKMLDIAMNLKKQSTKNIPGR